MLELALNIIMQGTGALHQPTEPKFTRFCILTGCPLKRNFFYRSILTCFAGGKKGEEIHAQQKRA